MASGAFAQMAWRRSKKPKEGSPRAAKRLLQSRLNGFDPGRIVPAIVQASSRFAGEKLHLPGKGDAGSSAMLGEHSRDADGALPFA